MLVLLFVAIITYPKMLNAVEAQIFNFSKIKKHLPFKISADYMLTLSRIP